MAKMTKSSLKKQVKTLLRESLERGIKRIDVLLNSGAISVEDRDDDDLGLAKVLACHILNEESGENAPMSVKNLIILKNLANL